MTDDATDSPPALPLLELVEATLNLQGKTKTWLAEHSDVTRAAINNWRRQPRSPQAATVLAVADALGIEHGQALRLAGLSTGLPETESGPLDLTAMPTDALVQLLHRATDELSRRPPA